ncbi:cell wall protein DAN4-like [Helianthus annuus]|uniref:cell wall protein DAN4-like n=1 Tax=Helianthus annuus TaxID=4232 RepID=UPI000B8FADF4|nr:cell wall protein DAN4-like [Helianthus annuus]
MTKDIPLPDGSKKIDITTNALAEAKASVKRDREATDKSRWNEAKRAYMELDAQVVSSVVKPTTTTSMTTTATSTYTTQTPDLTKSSTTTSTTSSTIKSSPATVQKTSTDTSVVVMTPQSSTKTAVVTPVVSTTVGTSVVSAVVKPTTTTSITTTATSTHTTQTPDLTKSSTTTTTTSPTIKSPPATLQKTSTDTSGVVITTVVETPVVSTTAKQAEDIAKRESTGKTDKEYQRHYQFLLTQVSSLEQFAKNVCQKLSERVDESLRKDYVENIMAHKKYKGEKQCTKIGPFLSLKVK